jgi:hypothetical protein
MHLAQGKTVMYAGDTSILHIGRAINEPQITTSVNTGFMNQTRIHYIPFQTKQAGQESELLQILTTKKEMVNVKSTNVLGVTTDSNLS